MAKITAPFTTQEVDALNAYQRSGVFHEFTCGNDHLGNRVLVATARGWICCHCDYEQSWAHDFMAKDLGDLMPGEYAMEFMCHPKSRD